MDGAARMLLDVGEGLPALTSKRWVPKLRSDLLLSLLCCMQSRVCIVEGTKLVCLEVHALRLSSEGSSHRDRHRDTETQRHRDTETQRHRDTETQRHRDTETQRHRDTETQRHRDNNQMVPQGPDAWRTLTNKGNMPRSASLAETERNYMMWVAISSTTLAAKLD